MKGLAITSVMILGIIEHLGIGSGYFLCSKDDGLVKSQEFVIFSISHLMISMGYEPGFL